jgi:hypothetical protein
VARGDPARALPLELYGGRGRTTDTESSCTGEGGNASFGGATGALFVGHDLWIGSFRGEDIGRYLPAAGKGRQ